VQFQGGGKVTDLGLFSVSGQIEGDIGAIGVQP